MTAVAGQRITIKDSAGTNRLRIRAFSSRDFGLNHVLETAGWMLTHSGSISDTSTMYGVYPQGQFYKSHIGYIFDGYDEALWGTTDAPTTGKVNGWGGLILAGALSNTAADTRYLHLLHGGTANYKITFPAALPADNKILKVLSYSGGNATLEWADASTTYTAGTGLTLSGTTFNITSPVTAALGGTGVTSLTTNYVLIGNGTGTPHLLNMNVKGNIMIGRPTGGGGTFPSPIAVGSNGQVLTADSGETLGLKWANPGLLDYTATASGSVPTTAYGIFRYTLDGGGDSADTLAFSSAQVSDTPASDTAGSSFWSMLNESDGSSGSRLIFEPIVGYGSSDYTKNNAWIGYHNILVGIKSYYFQAGNGSASYPSITFVGNQDNGFFHNPSQGTSTISVSIAGTEEYVFSTNYFKPVTNDQIDLGTSAYKWDDVYATNGTIETSDRRLKDQIKPTTLGLDFINGLNPVSYKWNSKSTSKSRHITHYGLVAQEVIDTLKDFGVNYEEGFAGITGDEKTTYGARYTEFVPILIKAVQELTEKIKKLEGEK